MSRLKLKIAKSNRINPATKQMGFAARVITNGTKDYEEICEDAAEETTFNEDEIKAAAGIFCRKVAKFLKQGYIVDLGPIGKLYPSCSSGWFKDAKDLTLDSVKPSLVYRAADDIDGAIKGASLVWAKAEDEEEEENGGETPSGGGSDTPSGGTTTGGDEPGEDRP